MTFYYGYKLFSEVVNRYNIAIIEYILVLLVLFMLVFALGIHRWRIYQPKLLEGILILLSFSFLYSFHNSPTSEALKNCVVFICGFLLCIVFSLLMTEKRLDPFLSSAWLAMFLVFIINLLYIFMGAGILQWGTHWTLNGMYYYKTDYATFLLQFLCITQYKLSRCIKTNCQRYKKIFYISIIAFTSFVVVLSGSRIFIVMLGIYYVILYFHISGKSVKIMFRIKTMLFMFGASLIALACLNLTAHFFPDLNILKFDFKNIFSEGNTQGRSLIWHGIANFMLYDATLRQKFLGVDLVSSSLVNQKEIRAHSMYIYVWYSFGIVGVCLFMIFLLCVLRTALKTKNQEIAYLLILSLGQTMISGLTQEIIIFTQQTWFLFMILGIALAERNSRFYDYQTMRMMTRNKV